MDAQTSTALAAGFRRRHATSKFEQDLAECLKARPGRDDCCTMAEHPKVNGKRATATLGAVLRSQRERQQVPIDRVATLCGVLVDEVEAVENDDHDLSPLELDRMMQHYRDPSGGSRQTLGELTLDLTGGYVAYTDCQPDRQIADPVDRVLAQYVQMLYQDRDVEPGTRVPIKDIDLTVLRLALSVRQPEVVKQIRTIQQGRTMTLARVPQPVVAAGGLALLGAVVLGLLMAAPSNDVDGENPADSAVTQFEVPGAVSTDLEPSTTPPDALASTEGSVTPVQEITVEIGEAATLVRPPG